MQDSDPSSAAPSPAVPTSQEGEGFSLAADAEARSRDKARELRRMKRIALAALLAIGFFTEPWLHLTETASQAAAARFVL